MEAQTREVKIVYDDSIVRKFMFASIIFGIVGMLVGVIVALQLAFWELNLGVEWLVYSRLRPLHTNAVIFAFVGNMMFAGVYYSTQRLLKQRTNDLLSAVHFWGWQLIILGAVVTLPLGITSGKEYGELEWPIDLLIAVIWVVFAVNFFWTIARRHEKNLYVAIWFYIATVITVAVLHIVNSLAIPVTLTKSYVIWAGVQDALIQWWYGHNAVAFFLTTPILGIMYYFLPKAAERPVYSYRLSIVHFWSLVFMYIWAGPHHLLYTALPEWAQSVGMVFSVALWAPSWGGMLNGLLTLRGSWDKVRVDPVLKFFAAGVTFYGMATFEGPLMSIKSVSAISHYTDWVIGHVHGGALGWNGFMAAGLFYWLAPRLFGTKLWSVKLADIHFWTGTVGILLYMGSMWAAGIGQGLMWRAFTPDGALQYPDFVETLIAIKPLYIIRMVGGLMYLTGFCLLAFNIFQTVRSGKAMDGEATVLVADRKTAEETSGWALGFGRPVLLSVVVSVLAIALGFVNLWVGVGLIVALALVMLAGWKIIGSPDAKTPDWHAKIERHGVVFTALVLVAMLVGGVVEIVPTVLLHNKPSAPGKQVPYTALELEGRDVYVTEGCYVCHSQMIRPMLAEKLRYGDPSTIDESIYDHPFQWGSKRTGPDLARVGVKYPNLWHYTHMIDPRATSPGSNMPSYKWLADLKVDGSLTSTKLSKMRTLGVPYTEAQISGAREAYKAQAEIITQDLARNGAKAQWDSKLVALIAYLQRLGNIPTTGVTVTGLETAPPGTASALTLAEVR